MSTVPANLEIALVRAGSSAPICRTRGRIQSYGKLPEVIMWASQPFIRQPDFDGHFGCPAYVDAYAVELEPANAYPDKRPDARDYTTGHQT